MWGNEVKIITGEAKGSKGIVTGTHGGCEHVMIDFSDEVLSVLTPDDKFLVKACGQGLELEGYPDIKIWSLAPSLFEAMKIEEEPVDKKNTCSCCC